MRDKLPPVSTAQLITALQALGIPLGSSGGGGGGGGVNGLGVWQYKYVTTAPNAGELTFNNIDILSSDEVRVNKISDEGNDLTVILGEMISVGSSLYIQNTSSSAQSVFLIVTEVTEFPTYFNYDFTQITGSGLPIVDGVKVGLVVAQEAATPGNVIDLINQGLGNVWWQQGISDAVFVRDFSSDSEDLAPYLNGGTGEWDIPDGVFMIVDTNRQSLESVIGREINCLGDLTIQPTVPGGIKGISMSTGEVSALTAVKMSSGGSLFFGDIALTSDDVSRPFFDLTDCGSFNYRGTLMFLQNPGNMNCGSIRIEGPLVAGMSLPFVVGEKNSLMQILTVRFPTGFLGATSDVFDISSLPTAPERNLDVQNCIGNTNTANTAIFALDQDNGEVSSVFSNCVQDNLGDGTFIRAKNDAAFNASPQKSVYQAFDIVRFVVTQRLAEVGIVAGATTTIAAANTPTDLSGTFILDQATVSGFEVGAVGQIIHKVITPATYRFSFTISGNKTGGGTSDFKINPSYKPAAGAYSPILIDDGVNSEPVEITNEFTSGGDPGFMALSFTQRFDNIDDEVKIQIQNLTDTDDWVTSSMQFICSKVA